jgi:heptosyltransferase-2
LIAKGWQVWVLGSARDKAAADDIARDRHGIFNLCGKTQLLDTVDLLACAESVVSNDSGLMHVAAAIGSRVNVVYGSSTPEYTPPLADEEMVNIFYLGLDCSPCFDRVCRFGHYDCLKGIKPDHVLSGILSNAGSINDE